MIRFILLLLLYASVCNGQADIPGEYPQASKGIISEGELNYYPLEELSIMRNEIFARYGYIFKNPEYRDHFTGKEWYTPRFADVTSKLTEIEKTNIKHIMELEEVLRPAPFKKLMVLRLPLNLEQVSSRGFHEIIGVKTKLADKSASGFIGVLPDTSKYYGVLWYADGPSVIAEATPRIYMVTTYTKQLTEIATTVVSLPTGGIFELGTECQNTNIHHSSFINQDLTYSSYYTFDSKCPSEDVVKYDYGVAGVINKEGSIVVKRNKQF